MTKMEFNARHDLLEGEVVLQETRLSKAVIFIPVFFCCLLMLACPLLLVDWSFTRHLMRVGCWFFESLFGPVPGGVTGFWCAIFGGFTLLVTFAQIWNRASSVFVVTNKRILIRVGILSRRSLELLLQKIESIGVHQSILGRMLNYGTVIITGTGGTKERFPRIDRPMEFRKRAQEQIEAIQKK